MQQFQFTTRLVYGAGALDALRRLACARALVVTDPGVVALGFVETVRATLPAGAAVEVFAEVEPDPSLALCRRGADHADALDPDTIVALGGGSAIDAAKGIWMLHAYPGLTVQDFTGGFGRPRAARARRVQFVAIPTTSGTSSEVSRGMVLTDRDATPPRKHVAYCDAPDLAVVDPRFPAGMPPAITADTGYDAFVHCLEAFASTGASAVSDALAARAIRRIAEILPRAYVAGGDLAAREAMHTAATLAGMAMIAGLGLIHAMAHQLGAAWGIPHGRANALLTPHVLRFNAADDRTAARYAELADLLGVGGGPDGLVGAADALRERVRIPGSIAAALDVAEPAFAASVAPMARNALADLSYATNPRRATAEDVAALYRQAWEG